MAVKTMTVETRTNATAYKYSGTVEEDSGTELSFPVSGTITAIRVTPGQRVAQGQLIAMLDPTAAQSSHDAAKAALEQAEDAHNRMKKLHDAGSLPEAKWVEVQSKLRQARSVEEIARKNLTDCRLYAPFSGIVAEKSADVGQNILPGIPVTKLVTTHQLNVKFAVPETEIPVISLGQEATITIPALNGYQATGKVVEKGIIANPLSRSYEVKVKINKSSEELMPGMVTEVMLPVDKGSNSKVCVIPANIVMLDEANNNFVWLDASGIAKKRIITCGEFTADGVTVTSGLKDGDQIIVSGMQKVCEGTAITGGE